MLESNSMICVPNELDELRVIDGFSAYSIRKDGVIFKEGRDAHIGHMGADGYPSVWLTTDDGKTKYRRIHRLLAVAWLPGYLPGLQVNHIDGDKTNMCLTNLEWVTPGDNTRHAWETGLIRVRRGAEHGSAKFDDAFVLDMYRLADSGLSQKEILAQVNISSGQLSLMLSGGTRPDLYKTHYGRHPSALKRRPPAGPNLIRLLCWARACGLSSVEVALLHDVSHPSTARILRQHMNKGTV